MDRKLLIQEYFFYIVLFTSPFIYAIQVIFNTYIFSYFFYVLMLFLTINIFIINSIPKINIRERIKNFLTSSDNISKIALSLAFYIGVTGVNNIYYIHSYVDFAKVLVFFVLPIVFFCVHSSLVKTQILLMTMAISGMLVGLETLWEFFHLQPTFFEKINFEYASKISGRQIWQLLGGLRHTGLVEHLHATQFILVVSFLCATLLAIQLEKKAGRILFLIASIISMEAAIANGARLLLIGAFLSWGVLFLTNRYKNIFWRQVVLIFVATVFLFYFSQQNEYFWFSTYLQYPAKMIVSFFPSLNKGILFQIIKIGSSNDTLNMFLGEGALSKYNPLLLIKNVPLFNIVFGVGFGATPFYLGAASDDIFIIQFLIQLGLVGSTLLLLLISTMIKKVYNNLRDLSSPFKTEAMMVLCFLILSPFVIFHSGILLRKSCWIIFCFAILMSSKVNAESRQVISIKLHAPDGEL